jgi:HAD superfamily phosphoserine phosphatase-like hydrolase
VKRAYLCDFDGTVSPTDVGSAFFAHFAAPRRAEWEAVIAEWLAGGLGARECLERECALVRATRAEALAFTRRFRLAPDFAPFAHEARARGEAVMVVSEGLDFYVADHLARAGLGDLPWAANHARFEPDGGLRAEFPHADPACTACGNCKAQHARRYRARGYRVLMVGDGLSDRCGARAADEVWARGELLDHCRREGWPARPFTGFASLAGLARTAR